MLELSERDAVEEYAALRDAMVRWKAVGARIPGKGKLNAIEDAPGSYVKAR